VTAPIRIDVRARRAWPFLPAVSRAGRIHLGPTGEQVRVREDGGADPVNSFGHRSIASDPLATRAA
jgi:hypothetical protein